MYTSGLSHAELRDFQALLVSHHEIEVRVSLLDLNHNELGDISGRLVDGQVTVDATQSITRSLSLVLLDPNGALHLDSNSPDAGAMFADRMARIRYSVVNPLGTKRYTTPLFTGPLSKLERNGVAVQVEAQGKESLGMSPAWTAKTYKKGMKTTEAIKAILRDIINENFFVIPNRNNRLPRNVSVGGTQNLPWPTAKQLAASLGYQLYYDGLGVARMRRFPQHRSYTFQEDVDIKTDPDIGFDISNVVNAVEVWGKKPKKKKGKTTKKRPHARVVAARSHPLSPWSLGRSGGPRYLPRVIESDGITTSAEAMSRARNELRRGLLESLDVSFDSLVIPHLEELDVIGVSTSKFGSNQRLRKFAIPLTSAGSSTIGYVRNVQPKARIIHRRPGVTRRRARRA